MINREELINFFKELSEHYEESGLPSWVDFDTIIEYIELFPEKGTEVISEESDV